MKPNPDRVEHFSKVLDRLEQDIRVKSQIVESLRHGQGVNLEYASRRPLVEMLDDVETLRRLAGILTGG